MWLVRLKFNLNNSAELLTCGDGSAVYLVSKGKCSYVAHRELPLACIWIANILASALTRLLNSCWRVLRFSFGSGEWREASASRLQGFDRWSKLYQNLLFEKLFRGYSYIVTKSGPGNMVRTSSMGCKENRHATKEATELMRECPDGRWFNFVMAFDSVVILEKKGIPEHLLQLNVLDRPSFLRKVLAELEDMGEAINIRFKTKLHSPNNWYTENVTFISFNLISRGWAAAGGRQDLSPQHRSKCTGSNSWQTPCVCARWTQGRKWRKETWEKKQKHFPAIDQKLWFEGQHQQVQVGFKDDFGVALQVWVFWKTFWTAKSSSKFNFKMLCSKSPIFFNIMIELTMHLAKSRREFKSFTNVSIMLALTPEVGSCGQW